MRVLVTGANGYIGKHVVSALIRRGIDTIAADLSMANVDPMAEQLTIDIFQEADQLFEKAGKPDVFLHLAWKDGFMHNVDTHMLCLSDHYRLLRAMISSGVKQIAVMGSMHEVGYWEGAIDENTPCNPMSMYGIAKDALRRSLFQMTKGEDIVIQWLRGYYIFGDDERSSSIFGKITQAAKEGKTEFPFTSGKNQYDFISVEDLSDQIASVVSQKDIVGIINCCTGTPVSLSEQVNHYIEQNNYNITLKYGAFPDRPYDSPAVWGDNKKITQILKKEQEV